MNFKTRDGSNNIKGKPKIYIAGHPGDMKAHFERISAEILEISNCVIFYDEDIESSARSDQFLMDLEQMQLIVLIVSQVYTQEKTAAQSIVFPYATAEKHLIPVLPILEAEELEINPNDSQKVAKNKKKKMDALLATLNEMLGNRQFLDPHDTDKTAVSYKVKLKNYLDSVLVNDDLADKIRAAFDAYVFLSYRKKDRAYAQELMKLIHKNPFCRDIAIWYDEFLVPGEDFSTSIRDAMQKSELFTLMVTPSILEENNYVMTTEYPAAKDSSKKILPVTMVPTDTQKLKENYDGIPESINPSNEQLLSEAFERELANVMNPDNNNDPQHIFFIGLAYLKGIDAEIDKERALELITDAVQRDPELRPAIKQLADMYHTGEGTPLDYSEAAKWYKKLADLDRKNYEKDPTPEHAAAWIESMLSYGNTLHDIELSLPYTCDMGSDGSEQNKQSYDTFEEIVRFCEQTEISECWADLYISACKSMKNVDYAFITEYLDEPSFRKPKFYEPIITCAKRIIKSRNLPATLEELEQRLAQDESFKKELPLDTDYCKPFYLLCREYHDNCLFCSVDCLHLRGKKSDCTDKILHTANAEAYDTAAEAHDAAMEAIDAAIEAYDAAMEAIEIYIKLTGTDWTLEYLDVVTEPERRIELQKRILPNALTEKNRYDSFLTMKEVMTIYSTYIKMEIDFERIKSYYEECLATLKAFSELKCFPYILEEFYSCYDNEFYSCYDEEFEGSYEEDEGSYEEDEGSYVEDEDFINIASLFEAMLKKAPDSYSEVCAEDYFLYMCRVFRSCPQHYDYYDYYLNKSFSLILESCQKNDNAEKAVRLADKAIDALNAIFEVKDIYAALFPPKIDNIILGISWTVEKCKEAGKDSDAERLSQFINSIQERKTEFKKRLVSDALTEKDRYDSFLSMKAIMKRYYIFIKEKTGFERIKPYYEDCLAIMKDFSELKCFPYLLDEFYLWAMEHARDNSNQGFTNLGDVFYVMLKKAPAPYREVCAEDYFSYMCRVFRSCPQHYTYYGVFLNESFGYVFMCCVFQDWPREFSDSPTEYFDEFLRSCQKTDTLEKAIEFVDKAIDALNVVIEDKDRYAACAHYINDIVSGISWTIEKCKEMGKDSDAERLFQFINSINTISERRIELLKRLIPDALTEKDQYASFSTMQAITESYSIFIKQSTDFERIKPYYEECLAIMKDFSELKCLPYILDKFCSWVTENETGNHGKGFTNISWIFDAMLKKAPDSYREKCAEDYFSYMCRIFRSCPQHYDYYAYYLNESFAYVFMCCVFHVWSREYTFSPDEKFYEILNSCKKTDNVDKAILLVDKAIDTLNVIIEDKDIYSPSSPLMIYNIAWSISWTVERCQELGKDSDAERLSRFLNTISI